MSRNKAPSRAAAARPLKGEGEALEEIRAYIMKSFRARRKNRRGRGRTFGLELKFPLVTPSGREAAPGTVDELWAFLAARGWEPVRDPVSARVTGASTPGPWNDTVASTETGYCKTEFSLAFVRDLNGMARQVEQLRSLLRDFSASGGVRFLGHGIFPATRPGIRLLSGRSRARIWEKFHASNRHVPPGEGDDMHLLTINAASHVHFSADESEAVAAVNTLNGFVPAQLALNAHSSVWLNRVDPDRKSAAESFWDMWLPGSGRVGMPPRPFRDMSDYLAGVASLKPVFVEREGRPVLVPEYPSFLDYYRRPRAGGELADGSPVELVPEVGDIDAHNTTYWFNTRISRYFTVENRLNDQQPPDDLMVVPALTAGLVSNLGAAAAEVARHDWDDLLCARREACARALDARAGRVEVAALAGRMLELAREGLEKRGLGEEKFLTPLDARLKSGRCPADGAEKAFRAGGLAALVETRAL